MKTLAELRLERAEVVKKMEALTKVEPFGEDQRTEIDELKTQADGLDEDIARLEDVEARKIHLTQPAPTNDPPPIIEIGDAPEDRGFESFGEQLSAVHRAAVTGYRDPRLARKIAPCLVTLRAFPPMVGSSCRVTLRTRFSASPMMAHSSSRVAARLRLVAMV
jgi:hypothetical protein